MTALQYLEHNVENLNSMVAEVNEEHSQFLGDTNGNSSLSFKKWLRLEIKFVYIYWLAHNVFFTFKNISIIIYFNMFNVILSINYFIWF